MDFHGKRYIMYIDFINIVDVCVYVDSYGKVYFYIVVCAPLSC